MSAGGAGRVNEVGLELGVVTEPPGPEIKLCRAGCRKKHRQQTRHKNTRKQGGSASQGRKDDKVRAWRRRASALPPSPTSTSMECSKEQGSRGAAKAADSVFTAMYRDGTLVVGRTGATAWPGLQGSCPMSDPNQSTVLVFRTYVPPRDRHSDDSGGGRLPAVSPPSRKHDAGESNHSILDTCT